MPRSSTDMLPARSSCADEPSPLLKRFESLIKETIGFDQNRGDSVSVINQAFMPTEAEIPPVPLWQSLMGEGWLQKNRPDFLAPESEYPPLEPGSGHYKLLSETGRSANWDIPYDRLD